MKVIDFTNCRSCRLTHQRVLFGIRKSNKIKNGYPNTINLFHKKMEEEYVSLEWAPPHIRDNREKVLEIVKNDLISLIYASDRLKDDEEIVLATVCQEGGMIEYASERLRDHKKIVKAAIENDPYSIGHASDRLKNNKKLIMYAIKKESDILELVSSTLKQDQEFMTQAILENGSCMKYANKKLFYNKSFLWRTMIQPAQNAWLLSELKKKFLIYHRIFLLKSIRFIKYRDELFTLFKNDCKFQLKFLKYNQYSKLIIPHCDFDRKYMLLHYQRYKCIIFIR